MVLKVGARIDGRTLEDFLGVTRDELVTKLDNKTLVAAARDDGKRLSTWLSQTKWQHLPGGMADQVCNFLQANLIDVFAGAWAKYGELKKYARETRKNGNTLDVSLAEHEFTYEMEPPGEILLTGKKITQIPCTIQLICAVGGRVLYLKKGCVRQVRSGKCTGKANI